MNTKTGMEKIRKIMNNPVFLRCKNMEIHCKGLKVLQGGCTNGKFIKKTSKRRYESIPKSMKNQCKFHARKSDGKSIKKQQTWTPKGNQKQRKFDSGRFLMDLPFCWFLNRPKM
jgi:hypothetical protein